jgi:hypothetical protein
MGRLANIATRRRARARHGAALAGRGRQFVLALSSAFVASLAIAGSAGAVVVDMNAAGPGVIAGNASVPYNSSDQSGYYGVSLIQPSPTSSVADPRTMLTNAHVPWVTTAGSCTDPWLAPGFSPLAIGGGHGLCAHPTPGSNWGSVLPATETFAVTWDPSRLYWQGTHDYLARFLSDVAAGSGTLSSPFALTGQYGSQNGVVANSWRYGGGCTDQGGSGVSCQFTSSPVSGPPSLPAGNDYTASGASCSDTSGNNEWAEFPDGGWGSGSNSQCITDSEIQGELQRMVPQTNMLSHLVPGFKPLVVVLTPPGVVDCLDAAATLCSVNGGGSSAKFCSYHGQVTLPGGATLPYVVQPWTASWDEDPGKYPDLVNLGCDDPEFEKSPIPIPLPDNHTFAQDAGARLVSPLSQGLIAAATNPFLNGWYSFTDGSEINDDGCVELGNKLDTVTVGTSSQNPYVLQREFNNGGVLATDPNSPRCAPQNTLDAVFVAPSAVNVTDEVQLDGSATASTLQIAPDKYVWNFGDNSQARGPSVVHTYTAAGTYTVTLTVTDRGGNTSTYAQNLTVLTADGKPAPPPATSAGSGGGGSSSGGGPVAPFQVHLVLLPQSLRSMLRSGVALQVNSNQRASGLVTVSISRQAAKRAGIAVGHAATVAVGRGTVSQVANGRAVLHLRLSSKVAAKLRRLRHLTVTVHLALVPAVGRRLSIVIAGRY